MLKNGGLLADIIIKSVCYEKPALFDRVIIIISSLII